MKFLPFTMPVDSTIEINDRAFIPNVMKEPLFITRGYLTGLSSNLHWVVVDPLRHPMHVWEKTGTSNYVSTAKGLGAVAFTNGPMMEPGSMLKRIAIGATTGAIIVGGVALKVAWAGPKAWLIGIVGAAVGAIVGGAIAAASKKRGVPYREVRGKTHDVYDEGAQNTSDHYWLRRAGGIGFSNYDVNPGDHTRKWKDADAEVIDGLICVVKDFVARSTRQGAVNYNEPYERVSTARAAIWALIPIGGAATPASETASIPAGEIAQPILGSELQGVMMVSPQYPTMPMAGVLLAVAGPRSVSTVQSILVKIGTRDAVAMDGNESMMIGSGGDAFHASATIREPLLDFGFYCK